MLSVLFAMRHSAETYSQCTQSSNVTRHATLCFDDEDSVSTGRSTLLDGITRVDQGIQTRVTSERKVGKGHIVGKRSRQVAHRDLEAGIVASGVFQDLQRMPSFKSADHEQSVESMRLESGGDSTQVDVGQGSVGAEFGTTSRGPVVDPQPGELVDIVL